MQSIVPSSSVSSTPLQDEKLNITKITHVYLDCINTLKNVNNIDSELTSAIGKISSVLQTQQTQQPQSRSQLPQQSQQKLISDQSNKLESLKEALNSIKKHHSSLKDLTSKSQPKHLAEKYKKFIKKTLKVYKNYLLVKFSSDGNPDNCDPDIKKILTNFSKHGKLFASIESSNDHTGLKEISYDLNAYLSFVTILAESTVNSNPSDPNFNADEQAKNANDIKSILKVFPGSSTEPTNDFACIQGTRQRIQDAIFSLKKSSSEATFVRENIIKFSAKIAPKVDLRNQVHLPASLLGSLLLDRKKVAKIDNFHTSPQKNIPLRKIIDFSHNFAKNVTKDLFDSRAELIADYELLKKSVNDEVYFKKLDEFVEKAKIHGFEFLPDRLLINEHYIVVSDEIPTSELIPAEELQDKCLIIPTSKFKEELSKIKDQEQSTIDYLLYLPAPRDLFKIHKFQSPESPTTIETITNRLDVNKIDNLVSLFPETSSFLASESQDELTKKSKMIAGLITLRNILDLYETSDDTLFYFYRFVKKFTQKNRIFFFDTFYENIEEGKIKSEFTEEEASIIKILFSKIRISPKPELQILIKALLSIENFESEENKVKFMGFLTENNLKIKNNYRENLLTILYQFDEEAFKTAIERKPELIQTIVEKDIYGTSLIQKLARKDLTQIDIKELFLDVLEKYKTNSKNPQDPEGTKALIEMINKEELLFDVLKKNNPDVLKEIIKKTTNISEVASATGAEIDNSIKLDFNKKNLQGDSLIHIACSHGYDEIVDILIANGADINQPINGGKTPLHLASVYGHVYIVETLIAKGADINQPIESGETPLHLAVINRRVNVVETLIAKGADVNQSEENGITPLLLASSINNLKIINALLNNGALPDKADNRGMTPLLFACENGNFDIVKLLIENHASVNKPDNSGLTPLHYACKEGNLEVIKFLIENGAVIDTADEYGLTPLHIASENDNLEIVKFLIEKGALKDTANRDEETPLHYACKEGNLEVIKFLIEKGASIDTADVNGETPLHFACKEGNLEVIKFLIEKGASINTFNVNEDTPLYYACKEDNLEVVKFLIEKGASIDTADIDGETLLYYACKEGKLEIVETLLNNRASPDKADDDGLTPLHIACIVGNTIKLVPDSDNHPVISRTGNLEIVNTLLKNGAEINKASKDGITPLHIACKEGHLGIVHTLLTNGASINKDNKDGITPLHIACKEGNLEIVNTLLTNGAEINKASKDGITPLHIACIVGNLEIVNTLLKAGANPNFRKVFDVFGDNPLHDGTSPLHSAVKKGHTEIVKALLKTDILVDTSDIEGATPLNIACKVGDIEIVNDLLNAGADPNIGLTLNVRDPSSDGKTPLHTASFEGHTEIVKALIASDKTNINRRLTIIEETALDIAKKKGHTEIIQVLEKKMKEKSIGDKRGREESPSKDQGQTKFARTEVMEEEKEREYPSGSPAQSAIIQQQIEARYP